MSASRAKKERLELTEQGISPKQLAQKEQAKKRKKTKITCIIVGILVVLLAAAIVFFKVIWPNTAPKTMTALKAGDHDITAAEMNYYYMDTVYQFYNQYSSYISYLLDVSKPLDEQYYDEDAGKTWADNFLDQAATTASTYYALYDDAKAEGMSLSDDKVKELDEQIENLRSSVSSSGNYDSLDDYLKTAYGKGCSEENYRAYLDVQALAGEYSQKYEDSLSYTDDDVETAYQKDPSKYTNVTYRSYYVSKSYFETDTTSGSDETTTADDASSETDTAAFDAAGAKADEMVAACKGDEKAFIEWAYTITPEDSKSTYEDDDATLCSDYSYDNASTYGKDWLYDSARQAGDVASFPANEAGYYVLYFLGTSDNDYTTANVRQIFMSATADVDANQDGTPEMISDDAWSTLQTKAEDVMQQWKDGDATEDSFAALAKDNSEDTNTVANGGLIENVYHKQLDDSLNDWCFDGARKAGDCELLKGEKGYYILYYVGPGENRRTNMVRSDLKEADYKDWYTTYQEKYGHDLLDSGKKYVNVGITLSGSK